jgi:hypothetical protein
MLNFAADRLPDGQSRRLQARDAELQALTTTVAELQQAVRRLTQTSLREERP